MSRSLCVLNDVSIQFQVDVDKVPGIASEYRVNSMPTFMFFKDGKVVAQFSGASIDKLRQSLNALK